MNLKTHIQLATVAAIGLLTACSTQKNTRMSRGYHNLTAHYNVYFNGNESLKQGEAAVISNAKNDYTRILPMFEYSDPENCKTAGSQMDRAIEKGVSLISKHSITKKPEKKGSDGDEFYKAFYNQKEFNKWVDDAYLLIGKANFYKRELDVAINTFDHVVRDFPNLPTRYEALLWKASAYSEKSSYSDAKLTLESYDAGGVPPKSLYGLYMAVYADMLLKQKKYDESIPYLKGAISGARNKDRKTRYQYILAQVYLQTGKYAEAKDAFAQVIKLKPPYDMAINAAIGSVSVVLPGQPAETTKREIVRLLKNKKNIDYRDRIYFALANAYLSDGDKKEAIANLRLSTQVSTGNDKQKAISFLTMGDVYYGMPEYKSAFMSYDSAMVYLPETDQAYGPMSGKHASLKELVDYSDAKTREDSLQNLSRMSETQRLAIIDGIIEAEKKKIEEQIELQKANMEGMMENDFPSMESTQRGTQQQGAKWYFYNPSSISMGKSEFERKWGKRKLEDNWRRANKAAAIADPEEGLTETAAPDGLLDLPKGETAGLTEEPKGPNKVPTRNELLKDIPSTPQMMEKSDSIIANSLLAMATVYRDKLNDYPAAADALNELLRRYPNTAKREEALIELYRTYQLSRDTIGLADTRKKLKEQFPNSKFTTYISDPQYAERAEATRLIQSNEYESTYNNYLEGYHDMVIDKATQVETMQPDNPLLSKYQLLKALSHAREGRLEPFKGSLEVITKQYPGTQEAELAESFLKELASGRMPVKSTASKPTPTTTLGTEGSTLTRNEPGQGVFSVDASALHSFIVWMPANTDMKRLRFNLADFNFGHYLVRDFELAVHTLPDKSLLMEVKGFERQSEVMEYFYTIRQYPEVFAVGDMADPKLIGISVSNLKYILSSGDIKSYFPFFIQVYLWNKPVAAPMTDQELRDAMGNLSPEALNMKRAEEQKAAAAAEQPQDGFLPRNGEHWFMMSYLASGVNHAQLLNTAKGFANAQQPNNGRTVETIDFSTTTKLLLVKGFASKQEAEAFAQQIAKSAVNNMVRTKKPERYAIAPANFDYLIKSGNWEQFKQFANTK